jgi:phosphatidylserine/phosphatidylglycerophosphate/cardiolipin synthase-like enzyme
MSSTSTCEFLPDFAACRASIVQLLRGARHTIFYSTFLCDFHEPLAADGTTFLTLIDECATRGVRVHVLMNPVVDYGQQSPAHVLAKYASGQVDVRCVVGSLGPNWLTRHFSRNTKYSYHHQKYLCMDGERIMVTGCDINSERAGWLRKNRLNYFWHELSVVVPCTPAMHRFCVRNHAIVNARPPQPLTTGVDEHAELYYRIMGAKHSVHIENQILITFGDAQRNKIGQAIMQRISNAVLHGDTFHVVILTNTRQDDEPSRLVHLYCRTMVTWSMQSAYALGAKYGLTAREVRAHLFIGRLECAGTLIKVHSNIVFVDSGWMLRSSSNLSDRSWSPRPCDTELGVVVQGASVRQFQQLLFHRYVTADFPDQHQEDSQRDPSIRNVSAQNKRGPSSEISFVDFFAACVGERGCLRVMEHPPSYYYYLVKLVAWILFTLGRSAGGGHERVTWTNTSLNLK